MTSPNGLSQVHLVTRRSRFAKFVGGLIEEQPHLDRDELLDNCVDPHGALFVVMRGAKPAGLVAIRTLDDDRLAEIVALVVKPEFRELGLGRRLVGAAVDAAERLGFSSIATSTGELPSDAVRLLARHGFLAVDRAGEPALEKQIAN
jgi:ribosomal protein S18 acetylase RimI-like enzyme